MLGKDCTIGSRQKRGPTTVTKANTLLVHLSTWTYTFTVLSTRTVGFQPFEQVTNDVLLPERTVSKPSPPSVSLSHCHMFHLFQLKNDQTS